MPQSGVIATTELVVRGSIARVPIALRGSVGNEGLQDLSGAVSVDKPLSSLLEALGADFGDAVALLRQLVGKDADITLKSLGVGYHAAQQQKFIEVVLTMAVGATSADFVVLKSFTPGGFIDRCHPQFTQADEVLTVHRLHPQFTWADDVLTVHKLFTTQGNVR